jgi:hypothetical protein
MVREPLIQFLPTMDAAPVRRPLVVELLLIERKNDVNPVIALGEHGIPATNEILRTFPALTFASVPPRSAAERLKGRRTVAFRIPADHQVRATFTHVNGLRLKPVS